MNKWFVAFILLCVLCAVYYHFQWRPVECCGTIRLETCKFKTGDIIWMKATDNNYATQFLCQFTHVGICVRCPETGTVYLYEAANPDTTKLLPNQITAGIFLTDVYTRISRYKGHCYLQPINYEPPAEKIRATWQFIRDTAHRFTYNKQPIISAVRQGLGLQRMTYEINCGELVRCAACVLGILPEQSFNDAVLHCLWYLLDIRKHCNQPYSYDDMYRVVESPVGNGPQLAARNQ